MKLVTAKEVAVTLKVSPEVITYLRTSEGLPYVKNSKYILFSDIEVVRWRNKKLSTDAKVVLNLKDYYEKTRLEKFIHYDDFKNKVSEIAFLDGDNLLQYVRRQNPEKDVLNLVGDIVHAYWDALKPKCTTCGQTIDGRIYFGKNCRRCMKKINPSVVH